MAILCKSVEVHTSASVKGITVSLTLLLFSL